MTTQRNDGTIRVKMLGGKCGCVFCKHGHTGPSTRAGWAGLGMQGKKKRKSGK